MRQRRFLLLVLGCTLFVALAITSVAVVARFSDGPIFVFPGGALTSGVPTEYKAVDWNRVAQVREFEFQLENPARSRITRFVVYRDTPYVPCAFCTNEVLKRWPRELEHDDRVVFRVGGMLVRGRAKRVPNDSDEYVAVRRAHALKYSSPSDPRSVVEGRAATLVIGAARLVPGTQDTSESDSWLYRIDPR